MKKLEVGQYWHELQNGKELLVSAESLAGHYACEVTKYETMQTEVREKYYLNYDDVINLGYVLGRHPDNIEQWQPKEGDLVWVKSLNPFKAVLVINKYNNKLEVCYFEHCEVKSWLMSDKEFKKLVEPYADQDKKIDFSKAGQWLAFGESIIKTCGKQFPETFGGHYLGQLNTHYHEFRIHDKWKLLTPEQINPILELIKHLHNE